MPRHNVNDDSTAATGAHEQFPKSSDDTEDVLGSGGGGAPGGSDTQIQYNNASAFGGVSGFTWNGSTLTAAVSTVLGVKDTDITLGDATEAGTGPNVVPTTSGHMGIGSSSKHFLKGWFDDVTIGTYTHATISDPPTDAQLDTVFGDTPANLGNLIAFAEDTTDNQYWLCVSDGTNWHTVEMARAV